MRKRGLRKQGQHGPVPLDGLPFDRKVGEALKMLRREKGIRLTTLATEKELDYTSVSRTESGSACPLLRTLIDRCDIIGLRPSDVVALAERL